MKIGLVDVDGHNFPNYALMKISAFHKAQGDEVEWANPFFEYDKVYKSKIFTFTPDDLSPYNCEVVKGGTGYDIASKLPKEIEEFGEVDYSIYPQYPFSIQFLSRGCIRQCPFCLVREKEGYIHSTPPTNLNPNGGWIEVLDNNFFANPNWLEQIKYLIGTKQPVNLHGVDVRIMNEEQAYWLNRLKELNIMPFVQPYRDFENERIPTQYEKDIAQWANKRWIFKACDFADFEPRKGFKCKEYLR